MDDFGQIMREYMMKQRLAPYEGDIGCSADDIKRIMKAQRVKYLPPVYLGFLRSFGRRMGGLFQGAHYAYEDLLTLKDEAIEAMSWEEPLLEMPANAFVFFGNQGVNYLYFLVGGDDDPAVYNYAQLERPHILHDHLSEFYFSAIDRAVYPYGRRS